MSAELTQAGQRLLDEAMLDVMVKTRARIVAEDGEPLSDPFRRDGGEASAAIVRDGVAWGVAADDGWIVPPPGFTPRHVRYGEVFTYRLPCPTCHGSGVQS